jgi:hypothetical protein
MRRVASLSLWIPILNGAVLGATIGLVAIDATCTPLFGEVSWDCQVHLLGWTLTPSVGMTFAAVLPAILGAALGLLLLRRHRRPTNH